MEKKNIIEITSDNLEQIDKFGKKYDFLELSFDVNGAYWHMIYTDKKLHSRDKYSVLETCVLSDKEGNVIADAGSTLITKKRMVDKIEKIFDLPSAKNIKLFATTKTLSGYCTRAPSKRSPAVKVNVRRMF